MITSDYGGEGGVRVGPKCEYVISKCSLMLKSHSFPDILSIFSHNMLNSLTSTCVLFVPPDTMPTLHTSIPGDAYCSAHPILCVLSISPDDTMRTCRPYLPRTFPPDGSVPFPYPAAHSCGPEVPQARIHNSGPPPLGTPKQRSVVPPLPSSSSTL